MPKFRKKPIEVEAEQFFTGTNIEGIKWSHPWGDITRPPEPIIDTLEGFMVVHEGDWIITGVQGEKYACKPDIFEATYEAIKGGLNN